MIVVAGPPGSGKSTLFPINSFGTDSFNADDRAAKLNGGSYQSISAEIRAQVNKEFENFVSAHIDSRHSFSIETTLRTDMTFRQARSAKGAGFQTKMLYLNAGNFDNCLKRVIARGFAGGHAAPVEQLKMIYDASLRNLARAIREIDEIKVYDSSGPGNTPQLVLETIYGKIEFIATPTPFWLTYVLDLLH